tara:strand:- start:7114 stop:8091 length:978 start_codon:yes stop_codon:yes gene_type:complete
MRNKTIFIADSGLGDFIVATGWINYYCKKYSKKALLLLGNAQREYFNLLKINYEFELITIESFSYLDFQTIQEIFSIRSQPQTLFYIKKIAKDKGIKLCKNFFNEKNLSFFYRRLFAFTHASKIHDFHINFPFSLFRLINNKKNFNYMLPCQNKIISKNKLKNKYNLDFDNYILIAGSGQDKTRKLTKDQINFFSENFNEYLVLVGKDWKLSNLNKNIVNLIDQTDLLDAISLIYHSKFVIAIDSALAHIANSFKHKNSMMIMGNAPKHRWGPLKIHSKSKLFHTNNFGIACRCKNCKGLTKNKSCMQELIVSKKCVSIIKSSNW